MLLSVQFGENFVLNMPKIKTASAVFIFGSSIQLFVRKYLEFSEQTVNFCLVYLAIYPYILYNQSIHGLKGMILQI